MSHNISAGRLKDYIEVYSKSGGQNEYGELLSGDLIFDAWADCKIRSSSESSKFGTTLAQTIVTVLMWNDERLKNDMVIKWNGVDYDVVGMPQSEDNKSMIVTMEVSQ